eukprot:scaffold28446_cov30-Phaeocystis_antarctica.AAC.1
MGLRTGSIQEDSQPGPRLDRKARAGKDPTAQWGFKTNQASHVLNEGLTSRALLSMRGRHSHHDHGLRQGVIAPYSRRHA